LTSKLHQKFGSLGDTIGRVCGSSMRQVWGSGGSIEGVDGPEANWESWGLYTRLWYFMEQGWDQWKTGYDIFHWWVGDKDK